jgi:hypothetical protein
MRTRIIKRTSEKADLIRRLSDEGFDLAIFPEEPPGADSKLEYELRPDGVVIVSAPYDYDSLSDWLYCGNWLACHPHAEGFRPIDTFRMKPEQIAAACDRFGIALLIDSFHDDIEWNVIDRSVRFLRDEPSSGARRRSGVVFGIASLVAFALAVYMVLWAISAFNLAFADCRGHFSIDASDFRCQRPIWLTYAFWLFSGLGVLFAVVTFVRRQRPASV